MGKPIVMAGPIAAKAWGIRLGALGAFAVAHRIDRAVVHLLVSHRFVKLRPLSIRAKPHLTLEQKRWPIELNVFHHKD